MRMSLTAGSVVPLTYNIKGAAEHLGVSKWWLQKFLRQHPVDKARVFTSQSVTVKGSRSLIWNAFWK
jgi:hypothetical protein